MADILHDRALNDLSADSFLGKEPCGFSDFYSSPPDARWPILPVSIDRRLTWGETWEGALEEIRRLPAVEKYAAKVSMYDYDRPSWTGLVYPTECYFPAWVIPEDHPATKALMASHGGLYGEPRVDKWTFSTNGVAIMGRSGIPCIGFGPGAEAQAHAPNEKTWKADLVKCAAVYAAVPTEYAGEG
jgi:putative selenium metabolism hydrolase